MKRSVAIVLASLSLSAFSQEQSTPNYAAVLESIRSNITSIFNHIISFEDVWDYVNFPDRDPDDSYYYLYNHFLESLDSNVESLLDRDVAADVEESIGQYFDPYFESLFGIYLDAISGNTEWAGAQAYYSAQHLEHIAYDTLPSALYDSFDEPLLPQILDSLNTYLSAIAYTLENRDFCDCEHEGDGGFGEQLGDFGEDLLDALEQYSQGDQEYFNDIVVALTDLKNMFADISDYFPENPDSNFNKYLRQFNPDNPFSVSRDFWDWKKQPQYFADFDLSKEITRQQNDTEYSTFTGALIAHLENAALDRAELQKSLLNMIALMYSNGESNALNKADIEKAGDNADDAADAADSVQSSFESSFDSFSFSASGITPQLIVNKVGSTTVQLPSYISLGYYTLMGIDFDLTQISTSYVANVASVTRVVCISLYYALVVLLVVFCLSLFYKFGVQLISVLSRVFNW